MKRIIFISCAVFFCFAQFVSAQISTVTLVQIVKAEDERRWDATLENLLKNSSDKIRTRAALAAGRIGDENSIPALVNLLKDTSIEVQTMAMFALGETESPKASTAILDSLKMPANGKVRARATEAAGKIAAANPKDANTPELGRAIVSALNHELSRNNLPDYEVVLLGITAVLRARPEGGESVIAILLSDPNARIRADALNTLARLRSKNVNDKARELLQKDSDPIVRANAARMLGVGEDKSAVDLLLNAATKDSDSRVRVSAIRSLGSLKDAKVADGLLERAENLLADYKKSKFAEPIEKNELLEIAATLGRILANTDNSKAKDFLTRCREWEKSQSSEIEIAYARISPSSYSSIAIYGTFELKLLLESASVFSWKSLSSVAQGFGELANIETIKDDKFKKDAEEWLRHILKTIKGERFENIIKIRGQGKLGKEVILSAQAIPDVLRAYAQFKTDDLQQVLREHIEHQDVFIRATSAELLGEQPATKENIEALKIAFTKSLLTDKHENDAQLAILDALYKLDKKAAVGTFLIALDAPDYLVRKKAFEILKDKDLQRDFPGIPTSLENALAKKKNQILPYASYTGTKLGQILNSNADYVRAVSRKNGTVKAVLTTSKGAFTIDLTPEDAPLTVDNFIKLARANYFNGVAVHRVVPNFVMQDGDPRGDGNGGPGWQIRDEINMLSYERGAVGMALSGKDTGGSQWFVTHAPQPHLDGGYTVFGRVNEADMEIVDTIVRGDKILSVKIIEENLPQRTPRTPRKKI